MQYRIKSIKGWRNPAIIRVKDGAVIGYVYAEHADEIKPYLGQGVVADDVWGAESPPPGVVHPWQGGQFWQHGGR